MDVFSLVFGVLAAARHDLAHRTAAADVLGHDAWQILGAKSVVDNAFGVYAEVGAVLAQSLAAGGADPHPEGLAIGQKLLQLALETLAGFGAAAGSRAGKEVIVVGFLHGDLRPSGLEAEG